ncbi:MAG: prolyl oligopeptidase family serine peptidase [Lautropia sp.]|nr:prolyl oligopeptidase family serine peptidase [Lautropia sp.]
MAIAHVLKAVPPDGAAQLFLLFCDAGQRWQDLMPLSDALGEAFASSAIVVLQGPHAVGDGSGWLTWPVTEDDLSPVVRPGVPMSGQSPDGAVLAAWDDATLAAALTVALPGCLATIRNWQAQMKVLPEATALIGLGEGATVALAAAMSSMADGHPVCGRISTVGGRFGPVPEVVSPALVFHLVHGKADAVVPFQHSVHMARTLVQRDADVVADIVPHEGHEPSAELVRWLLDRLRSRVPRHLWQAAMRVQGSTDPGGGCGG